MQGSDGGCGQPAMFAPVLAGHGNGVPWLRRCRQDTFPRSRPREAPGGFRHPPRPPTSALPPRGNPANRRARSPMSLPALPDDANVIVVIIRWRVTRGVVVAVAVLLSLFYLRGYRRAYDPVYGWTRMISFGGACAADALPRLQRLTHHVTPPGDPGADGQFYAQMALDPSLRDPGFDAALDNPTYRGRRIGLPALAYLLGGFKPRRVVQAYALANLFFWFGLLGLLLHLLRPATGRALLCLCAALLGYGVIASMELAVTDLPATTLLFAALALGATPGGYGALAAAALTRETSALAAFSLLDLRRPQPWRRTTALLAGGLLPLALWTLYVLGRFGHAQDAAGARNFSLPLVGLGQCFATDVARAWEAGLDPAAPLGWLYADDAPRKVFAVAGMFFQGLYLALRREPASAVWRTGVLYAGLCAVLGTAVWEEPSNAARATLPLAVCCYLRLARETGRWFWPFFVLGSLSLPYAVHEFWTYA